MADALDDYGFCAQTSITPKLVRHLSKCPDGYTKITLRDMNSHRDFVYKKHFIDLVICEDAMFGLLSTLNVLARDDNDDCINCSFHALDHYDPVVRENLAFGSKITVLNPYHRLASTGTVTLRVDEPRMLIYKEPGADNPMCRYCWKENPQHSCAVCKRVKYCGRRCQSDDWAIMKHKLICGLRYFDFKY